MVLPLLPIYAKQFTLDESGVQLGLLMASFSAMQFLFAPLWGRLSDRIGRRPVLMIGLAGSGLFYALFGVATVLGRAWPAVRRPDRGGHRRRHHLHGPGLHRRHDVAGEPGQGNGVDRRGIRLGIHLRPAVGDSLARRQGRRLAPAPVMPQRPCRPWRCCWRISNCPNRSTRQRSRRRGGWFDRAAFMRGDAHAVDRSAADRAVSSAFWRSPISKPRWRCWSKGRRSRRARSISTSARSASTFAYIGLTLTLAQGVIGAPPGRPHSRRSRWPPPARCSILPALC